LNKNIKIINKMKLLILNKNLKKVLEVNWI